MKKFNFIKVISCMTFMLFALGLVAQSNPDFTIAANGLTCLCPNANVGDSGTLNINGVDKTFTKRTRADLDAIISNDINDPEIALTCTSGITNMNNMFIAASSFNQNLEHWDVSEVTTMGAMFSGASAFNQPLNNWDVSSVTIMDFMFINTSAFNQLLDNWNVSNVESMFSMFSASAFNQPLDNWNVGNVSNMTNMFFEAVSFNQPLNNWDVSNVTNMEQMFFGASSFNQNLNNWNVSNVESMSTMFSGASAFNQPLNNWDVSSVTSMNFMFINASAFNQPLDNWDVSSVTSMDFMFSGAANFNQDISGWCVEQIPTEPTAFSTNSALQDSFKPNWGATCTLSVQDINLTNIKLYPNPTRDKVFIDNLNGLEIEQISIVNMLGQVVKSKTLNTPNQVFIDLSGLANATYFIIVSSKDGQQLTKRVIKQ